MQLSKDIILNTISKSFDDNYELNKKNIELESENIILKDKIKKLIQGNKSKQDLIEQLQEQIHKLEKKMNKNNTLNEIANITYNKKNKK